MEMEKNFEDCIKKLHEKLIDNRYANKMYAALCNMQWKKVGIDNVYSCSWRYAGGLVARFRFKNEDYLHFYCNGNEGIVDPEIETDLASFGWIPLPWPER